MAMYMYMMGLKKKLHTPPIISHSRKTIGKNCLMVAGAPNFLHTKGL